MSKLKLQFAGALMVSLMATPLMVPAVQGQQQAAPQATLKVGDEAPEISVAGWWQEKVPEKRAKGKVYVIDFWASWCPPCRESMPHLMQMQGKYGDYATFIGISIDQDKGAAAQFLGSMGTELPIYFAMDDDGQSWESWGTAAGRTSIPTTFIVNEENKIIWMGHPLRLEAPLRALLTK